MGYQPTKKTPIYWERMYDIERRSDGTAYEHRSTYRAMVPGGWLIKVRDRDGAGLLFYPDPDHAWDGSSLNEMP
jgi:hypothetical protein